MTEPKITRERLIELLDGAYLKATERPQDASVYLEQAAAYTLALQALDMEPRKEQWTHGHCVERQKPGGCQLHNLHCQYPTCDRRPAT